MAKQSNFNKLKNKIAKEYEAKGVPAKKAEYIGESAAYNIGAAKYGKKGMAARSAAARKHK